MVSVLIDNEHARMLIKAMGLTDNQLYVLSLHRGLFGHKKHKYSEIARIKQISSTSVRHGVRKAEMRLRNPAVVARIQSLDIDNILPELQPTLDYLRELHKDIHVVTKHNVTLNTYVDDLGMSVRTTSCLFYSREIETPGLSDNGKALEYRYPTVGEVLQMTREEVLKLKNLGKKSFEELRKRFIDLGFNDPWPDMKKEQSDSRRVVVTDKASGQNIILYIPDGMTKDEALKLLSDEPGE